MNDWNELPNVSFPEDDVKSGRVLMDLLEQHGFKFRTPMWVEEDEDMYPEGIGQCPNCLSRSAPYTFNMTNTIDGVAWTLHNCSCCETVSVNREQNRWWSVRESDEDIQ